MQSFFVQRFREPFGSWTPAPKIVDVCTRKCVFPAAPMVGRKKLFDSWASGRKGQECPQEIRTEKLMFMLFFSPTERFSETISERLPGDI